MEFLGNLPGHRDMVTGAAFSQDDRCVATGSMAGTTTITSLAEESAVSVRQGGRRAVVMSVLFHPGQPLLITVGGLSNALFWDVSDPPSPRRRGGLFGPRRWGIWGATGSSLTPDGKVLAVGGWRNTVTLVDIADVRVPRKLGTVPSGARHSRPREPMVSDVSLHPDGRHLAAVNDGGELAVWDIADPQNARRAALLLEHDGSPLEAVQYSPDGALLATGGAGPKAFLWDTADPAAPHVLAAIPVAGVPRFAFRPQGEILLTGEGGFGSDKISAWDISEPSRPALAATSPKRSAPVTALASSQDGRRFAAGYFDGTAELWGI